jgi:hypothetical protein
MKNKTISAYPSFVKTLIAVLVLTLGFSVSGGAQVSRSVETIQAGSEISVRTNEAIETRHADGQVFSGTVENDVIGRTGNVAIPRGADVELVVREIGDNDLALDLDSVSINGRRYALTTESSVTANRREGIGTNKRTGKYVGGGAIIGAIIGGITGGGKGAAIGAGAGAAAGAGAQVLTRGDSIDVPAESLLTFRLTQPIQTPSMDSRYYRNRQYQPGYGDQRSSAAYQAGVRAGRSDADRNLPRNTQTSSWRTAADRRDYEAGYDRGYNSDRYDQRADQRYKPSAAGSVTIGRDNNIRWQGPTNARVYVQVDNNPRQLFASGDSGTQLAPWIQNGHVYVFTVEDLNGREVARDRLDLRGRNR